MFSWKSPVNHKQWNKKIDKWDWKKKQNKQTSAQQGKPQSKKAYEMGKIFANHVSDKC